MSIRSLVDKIAGRIKEALGVLTDSELLRTQGKLDQEMGEMAEAAEADAAEAEAAVEPQSEQEAKAKKVEARLKVKMATGCKPLP